MPTSCDSAGPGGRVAMNAATCAEHDADKPVIGSAIAVVLLVVSAVTATAVAVLTSLAAVQGHVSSGEAILSIAGAALACVGLKAAALAGKTAFKIIM